MSSQPTAGGGKVTPSCGEEASGSIGNQM